MMKAFPWSIDNGESIRGEKGMDLRDYFAAKAMQGDFICGIHFEDFKDCGDRAYAMADIMMEARKKKND